MDMCQREGLSLQRGMNFGVSGNHSVILMSLRKNAPYNDRLEDEGTTLIYEGHNQPRSTSLPDPKLVDQLAFSPTGRATQNGKFFEAAVAAKKETTNPERVRVYEKIRKGIWAYNGVFLLVDAWQETDDFRSVFKFKLIAVEGEEDFDSPINRIPERRRIIPTSIKMAVWKRDDGCCTICGAKDELHFDHILPYAKGGTSIVSENVQLLCARHNLQKSDKIQ